MKLLFYVIYFISLNGFSQSLTEAVAKARPGNDRQAYKDVIQQNQKLFNVCYKSVFKAPFKIETGVVVEWQVDDAGTVRAAKVKRSTFDNRQVEDCIIVKIKEIEFPLAPEGQLVNIVYTLFFNKKTLAEK